MAAETKIISTITELITSGTAIAIKTSYQEDTLPDTLSAALASSDGTQDGVNYEQGDLIIQMKNSPANLSYSINNQGELVLLINTGDAGNYSIDDNGNLTYTTTT